MTIEIKIFNNEKELSEITGKTHGEMIDLGFDLDDISYGIAVPSFATDEFEENFPLFLEAMSSYCCGYEKYHDLLWTYYLVYHA